MQLIPFHDMAGLHVLLAIAQICSFSQLLLFQIPLKRQTLLVFLPNMPEIAFFPLSFPHALTKLLYKTFLDNLLKALAVRAEEGSKLQLIYKSQNYFHSL